MRSISVVLLDRCQYVPQGIDFTIHCLVDLVRESSNCAGHLCCVFLNLLAGEQLQAALSIQRVCHGPRQIADLLTQLIRYV